MTISLLTDFGLQDGFTGAMKGVILDINPNAVIVDISHDVAPQDVDEAVFLLRNAYSYFPAGTIHVVVVDPGVGGRRRAIIVEAGGYRFVGPDNGVFAYIYRMEPEVRVTCITNPAFCLPRVSRTFHGRDIFAPVAAHLSTGVRPSDCGPEITDYIRGHISEPVISRQDIRGHVAHIDRFGNVITDIPEDRFTEMTENQTFRIRTGDTTLDRLSPSYADVHTGEPLAIIDSAGLLEIAVNGGNAAQKLGVKRGDEVVVHFEEMRK